MILLVKNSNSSLLGGSRFSRFIGRTLRVKNYKSLLLTALLIGAVSTASAGTPCGTNLEYELNSTTLVLTSPDPSLSATIDAQAFIYRADFTDVIIPENVTEINTKAFQGCTALTSVVIPPSVTLVGEHAFYGCSSLSSVLCRPTTAPTLGTDAFTGCASGLQICVYKLGGEDGYNSTDWYTSYASALTLCFLDERDDQAATAGQIQVFRTIIPRNFVHLFRTLRKAGSFNTLTLPFNIPDIASSPLAGAEVYTFVGASVVGNELQLDIAPLVGSSLVAGVPYLIQWPNTGEVITHWYFSGITWDDDETAETTVSTDVNFVGFYGKTHIDDDANHSNLFIAAANTLYWPKEGDTSSMFGFRAYFNVNTGGASLAPIRRGMPAALRIVNTPTDIEQMTNDQLPMTNKTIKNGRIIINRNGESYSITGQKL